MRSPPTHETSGTAALAAMQHRTAVLLTLGAAALNSAGGIVVRNMEAATDWQIVFWRTVALAVAITAIAGARRRAGAPAALRGIGPRSLLGGLFFGVTLVGYVLALTHTSVANADFTMSAIPVFTALLAWLLLRERIRTRTALAIAAAVAGVALMLGDGLASGTLFGNAMALLAAVSFACFVIVLRSGHGIDMLPTTAVGALLAAIVAAFMADGDLRVPIRDLALCLVWGGVLSGAALYLIVSASRRLFGAELTLLLLIEFILGPGWVWLFMNEVPGMATLAGGAIVLAAVAGNAFASMRTGRSECA